MDVDSPPTSCVIQSDDRELHDDLARVTIQRTEKEALRGEKRNIPA